MYLGKIMKNKLPYLLVLFTIIFISNLPLPSIKISNNKRSYLQPRASDFSYVNYGENRSISFSAVITDRVYWGYSTNSTPVNITVMVMNETQYEEFPDKAYDVLSNGSLDNDYGYFDPPKNDIWYIVFYHNDSSNPSSTELTYYVIVFHKYVNPIPDLDDNDDDSENTSLERFIDLLYLLFYLALIFAGATIAIAYFKYRKRPLETRH
ncbi:MAG: hypothetical protein ACFE8A_02285 [Candidatus Hodarchaeota archaeon]